ncbi:hypothetical protein EW145_g4998 [Phellinidium pouzarii]|uniref:Macro domain-containing protein n=1 Tax=Phellinidium pouzarii TaxID=167371 RepID=A0A4S4L239_9AGAM|nr:hypothetical protein EW145_g4998 [Phellinidium pouzarii]
MGENIPIKKMPTLRSLYYKKEIRSYLDLISLIKADITTLEVDAIVNSTNIKLSSKKLDGCEVGSAKITAGYELPAKHVIHTVAPTYSEEDSPDERENKVELLGDCYYRCLMLAAENDLKTVVSFAHNLSTGKYSFPLEESARIALETVREFLANPPSDKIDLIIFTMLDDDEKKAYYRLIPELFPSAV